MTFHINNLGSFGRNVEADINGYVPTADTAAFDLDYEHSEATHDDDGNLTEYGEWWQDEGFPEVKAAALKATKQAEEAISDWQ